MSKERSSRAIKACILINVLSFIFFVLFAAGKYGSLCLLSKNIFVVSVIVTTAVLFRDGFESCVKLLKEFFDKKRYLLLLFQILILVIIVYIAISVIYILATKFLSF